EPRAVLPAVVLLRFLDVQHDLETGAQHRLRAQDLLQPRDRESRVVEILGIGPEADRGAGPALRHLADDLELRAALALREAHVVFLAVAADPDLEVLRQRIDHRDADAVQAAGVAVVLARELAARVQLREDQLDARNFLLRVNIHGHAAPVVDDLERAVLVDVDLDALRVPGDRLVDAVVDDLVREVVRTLSVRVHAGPAPHGL